MQCFQEVLVDEHRFVVSLFAQAKLVFEAFFLVYRVVQLAVSVGKFLAVHHQFEAFGQSRLAAVHLGQRAHLYGIVGDESGLYESSFAEFAEDFINQLTLAHGVVNLHIQFLAHLADFVLALSFEVVSGLFLDGFQDGQTAVGSFEADGLAVYLGFCTAVYGDTDAFQQFLRKAHHPVVVLVLHVQLHTSEFRVMVLVHTLVTEVLAYFIYTFESAHNQSLQVKLGGDTQVEVHIQRVMVGDERTGACSTGDGLKNRRLHFRVAGFIQHSTHGLDDGGTLQEFFFHAVVYDKVYITLTVAQFGVLERVVSHTILIFHDRQGLDALCKYGQLLGMDADFAHLGTEYESFDTDEVA